MPIDWEPLIELIHANERFVLSSHVRPDADAVGSELGLAAILEGLGKSVRIVNPSALPANLAFLDPTKRVLKLGDGITPTEILDTDVHIVVDTSAWVQLLDVGRVLKKTTATKVVIDHHVSADNLGALEFKDTKAEATGTLIVRLANAMNAQLPPDAATALFAAMATDTGWFRFPATTSETMRAAGALIDAGADQSFIYQQLYERRSFARVRLAGRVLGRIELASDGRIAYITVTGEDFQKTGAVQADTEELVNECLKIDGTIAAFIAIEQRNKRIKVSLRSRTDLDVAAVAEHFGGGGHKQAAGAQIAGPISRATQHVLSSLVEALNEREKPAAP